MDSGETTAPRQYIDWSLYYLFNTRGFGAESARFVFVFGVTARKYFRFLFLRPISRTDLALKDPIEATCAAAARLFTKASF